MVGALEIPEWPTVEMVRDSVDSESDDLEIFPFIMPETTTHPTNVSKSGSFTMPAILNSNIYVAEREKKSTREWNLFHYCLFCSYSGSNISRHLRRKDEGLTTGEDQLAGKKMELLRMRGDHKHNLAIIKDKEGSIVLARRKIEDEFDIEQYGPCPDCYSWIILTDITRHQRETCLAVSLEPDHLMSSSKHLAIHSKILKGADDELYQGASKLLKDQVIDPMHRGEIKSTVMSDRLIMRLGEDRLAKCSRNPLCRGNYASDRMWRAVRHEHQGEQSMEDFIKPEMVDTLLAASQKLSI